MLSQTDGYCGFDRDQTVSWLPKASAWDDAEIWRAKRQANSARSLERNAQASQGFSAASVNESAGRSDLTIRIAVARVTAATQAKLNLLR